MFNASSYTQIIGVYYIIQLENPLGFLACHRKKAAVCIVAVNLSEKMRGWIVWKVICSGKLEIVAVS